MLIVSQNKNKISNLDNIAQICVEEDGGWFIFMETTNTIYEIYGEYKSEERAKEVLQSFLGYYSMQDKANIKFNVFYMPED